MRDSRRHHCSEVARCCRSLQALLALALVVAAAPASGQTCTGCAGSQSVEVATLATINWYPDDPDIGEEIVFQISGAGFVTEANWDFGEPGCQGYDQLSSCTSGMTGVSCDGKFFRFASGGTKHVSVSGSSTTGAFSIGPVEVPVSGVGTCPGVTCTYSLNPTSGSFTAAGGNGTVSVTADQGCSWTASSNAGWLTITGGAQGSGSGSVSYSVAANSGGARSGTLSIAGETFTVNQQAAAAADTIDLVAACLSLADDTVAAGDNLTVRYLGMVAGTGTVDRTFPLRFYLSNDATITTADRALYGLPEITVSAPGDTFSSSGFAFVMPADVKPGSYYLGMIVDWSDFIDEADESNNALATPLTVLSGILYIPAAAHAAGVGGSNWRTDLEITAIGGGAADFTIALLEKNSNNSTPMVSSASVTTGDRRYGDVLSTMFGYDGSAALRITPTSGHVMATSRTYNDDPGGTYGQFIPAYPEHEALTYGQEARILQLSRSATTDSGYRTNIGFVNTTNKRITVKVRLAMANSSTLGTLTYELAPYEHDQVTDIFSQVTSGEVAYGFAVVWTTTSGGAFFSYASVVDNRSGDAIYIPAQLDSLGR